MIRTQHEVGVNFPSVQEKKTERLMPSRAKASAEAKVKPTKNQLSLATTVQTHFHGANSSLPSKNMEQTFDRCKFNPTSIHKTIAEYCWKCRSRGGGPTWLRMLVRITQVQEDGNRSDNAVLAIWPTCRPVSAICAIFSRGCIMAWHNIAGNPHGTPQR